MTILIFLKVVKLQQNPSGPIQVFMVENMVKNNDFPTFSFPGDLAINWWSYNNLVCVALIQGHLSTADVNDAKIHGLGF